MLIHNNMVRDFLKHIKMSTIFFSFMVFEHSIIDGG